MRLTFCTLALSSVLIFGCDSLEIVPETEPASAIRIRTDAGTEWVFDGCDAVREHNHSVAITGRALEHFVPGDVLYVFTPDGICAGQSRPFAEKAFALTAWGDDSMTMHKDGLASGDSLTFVVHSPRFSRPVELQPTSIQGPVVYVQDGISVIRELKRK